MLIISPTYIFIYTYIHTILNCIKYQYLYIQKHSLQDFKRIGEKCLLAICVLTECPISKEYAFVELTSKNMSLHILKRFGITINKSSFSIC